MISEHSYTGRHAGKPATHPSESQTRYTGRHRPACQAPDHESEIADYGCCDSCGEWASPGIADVLTVAP